MDMSDIIKFYSKSKLFKEFSNFTLHSFEIDNNIFISGEHAFHYFKYNLLSVKTENLVRKDELENYSLKFVGLEPHFKTPLDAKRGGGKRGKSLNNDEINFWNEISSEVQYKICNSRISADNDLKMSLLKSDKKYLLHQENRGKSPIWGGRIDKNTGELIGQNKLGKIWMKVREEL